MKATNKSANESLRNQTINGMSMKLFLPIAAIVWLIAFMGKLPADIMSTFIFVWTVGMFLQWVGNKTPILGKYIGFGGILPLFGASLLVTVGLISPELKTACNDLVNNTIIPIFASIMMTGAILGRLDRNMLKKAALRYIPVIIIGQIFAIVSCFLVGYLLGYDLFRSVVLCAFPCFSGGSGGPLASIPITISSSLNIDGSEFVGYMMAGASLANVEAILLCGILDLIGKKLPSLTGNGNLIRQKKAAIELETSKRNVFDGNFQDLLRTLMISGAIYIAANVISALLNPLINLNFFVYLILICIVLKLSGTFPKSWEDSFAHWLGLILPMFLPALIAGMGIGSIDLVSTFQSVTPAFLLLITITVAAFVIGSMLGGYLMGFYPIESGISVGCCSCNIGGTGDIICCETAHRMDLYPFAALSTRLGGSIALLELGFLLQFVQI